MEYNLYYSCRLAFAPRFLLDLFNEVLPTTFVSTPEGFSDLWVWKWACLKLRLGNLSPIQRDNF